MTIESASSYITQVVDTCSTFNAFSEHMDESDCMEKSQAHDNELEGASLLLAAQSVLRLARAALELPWTMISSQTAD